MPTIVTHYSKPLPEGPLKPGEVIIGWSDPDIPGGKEEIYVLQWDDEENAKTGEKYWRGVRVEEGGMVRFVVAGDPLSFLKSWSLVQQGG